MHIGDLISADCVITELKADSKQEALAALIDAAARKYKGLEKEAILSILLEREKLGSTGIGDGVAIPHGKLKGLDKVVIAVGQSPAGVMFDAADQKPVHLFFLLLAPEDSASLYLRVLAKISRMLKNPALRDELRNATSAEAIVEIIRNEEI